MTILITGATGNAGTEVIRFIPDKTTIVAGVRNIEKARITLGDDINYVKLDFEDSSTFATALNGVDKVFLVRPPAISDVGKYIAPFIEAAKQANVRQIVFLSLLGVENNRVVPHYKIEKLILESGIAYTFLRASFFMQNLNTTHLEEIRDQGEIAVPAGKGKTSFIDVRDIAEIGAKALTEDGHEDKAYTLTGSEAIDYYEVARRFSEILGKPVRYTNPSILKFGWRMYKKGNPLMYVIVMIALYSTARFGMAKQITPETETLLGHPPIKIDQYIKDYRDVWR